MTEDSGNNYPPSLSFPIFEKVIKRLIQCGFHTLFQNSGNLRHKPILLFLLFLFPVFVSLAHFFTST